MALKLVAIGDLPNQCEVSHYECCLYVLQEDYGGPVKVGIATHPYRRWSTLQSGNPRALHPLFVASGTRDECAEVERRTLRNFGGFIIRGEWISVDSREVIDFIEKEAL